ncbi:MAG: PEP-CTERM sorting domain-containing protein [Coleofasciculus sp. C2-GNP5-27]
MALAINKNILLRSLPVAAASVAVLAAHPSDAAIIGGSAILENKGGEVVELEILDPPPSRVELNAINSLNVLGFNEKQNVILPQDILADDRFDLSKESTSPNDVLIPTGTLVSSHFIFFDPPTANRRVRWSGQVTFDQEIIGIVARRNAHRDTNGILGLEDTSYNLGGLGLDIVPVDRLEDIVSFEDNVLSFSITTGSTGLDPVRVITAASPVTPAVPEPLTILGSGIALGFGVLFQGIKRK